MPGAEKDIKYIKRFRELYNRTQLWQELGWGPGGGWGQGFAGAQLERAEKRVTEIWDRVNNFVNTREFNDAIQWVENLGMFDPTGSVSMAAALAKGDYLGASIPVLGRYLSTANRMRRGLQQAAATGGKRLVKAPSSKRLPGQSKVQAAPGKSGCFVAGTPFLTPDGEKAVEQFRPGDHILSRPENDVNAPLEVQIVEDVFVTVALVHSLQVGGQSIRVTGEHPFWVKGKGWAGAAFLAAGDLLSSHDDQWVPVEAVNTEDREVTTVYNLRVANDHTYFVGCQEWGFSVSAHNTCFEVVKTADGYRVLTPTGSVHAEFLLTPGGRDAAYRLSNRLNELPRPGGPTLKWDAHDSIDTFGHTITRHGQRESRDALIRRAKTDGHQIGAWTNDRESTRLVADAVRRTKSWRCVRHRSRTSDGPCLLAERNRGASGSSEDRDWC